MRPRSKGTPKLVACRGLVDAMETLNVPRKKLPAAMGFLAKAPKKPVLRVVSCMAWPSYPSLMGIDGYSEG